MRARMRANSFVSDFPRYRGRIGKSCAAVRRWNRDHVCGGKTRMPVFGDRRGRSIWKACTRPLGRQLRTETCFQSSRSSLGKARLRLRNPGIPTDPPLAASYCCTCRCTCLPASVHPLAMHNSDTILSLSLSLYFVRFHWTNSAPAIRWSSFRFIVGIFDDFFFDRYQVDSAMIIGILEFCEFGRIDLCSVVKYTKDRNRNTK